MPSKERAEQYREEAARHWSKSDGSALLAEEPVKLRVERPSERCSSCGGTRVRRRRVDFPILEGRLVVPDVYVLYCADCKTSSLDAESTSPIHDALAAVRKLSRDDFQGELRRGSDLLAERLAAATGERRIVAIYFPSRTKGPRVAKISIRRSDPLCRALKRLGSADIRRTLGIEFFEELERAAHEAHRTISQYLHVALSERLLPPGLDQTALLPG